MGTGKRLDINKSTAAQISLLLRRQSAELNASLEEVERTCTPEEFTSYRTVIGKVMGTVFLEILEPLWEQYPELAPEALRDQYKGEPPRE